MVPSHGHRRLCPLCPLSSNGLFSSTASKPRSAWQQLRPWCESTRTRADHAPRGHPPSTGRGAGRRSPRDSPRRPSSASVRASSPWSVCRWCPNWCQPGHAVGRGSVWTAGCLTWAASPVTVPLRSPARPRVALWPRLRPAEVSFGARLSRSETPARPGPARRTRCATIPHSG